MYKTLVFAIIFLLLDLNVRSQDKPVSFEDLKALQTIKPRNVVVLIRTDWCKYCHVIQNMMLKNTNVSLLLRDKFYTVFLDAEEKKDIFFAGRTFKFKQGVNELAKELATMKGKVSYPTLCILNARNDIVYQYDGFLSAKALEFTLKKISGNDQMR